MQQVFHFFGNIFARAAPNAANFTILGAAAKEDVWDIFDFTIFFSPPIFLPARATIISAKSTPYLVSRALCKPRTPAFLAVFGSPN
jgi:hypothetical protein